MNGSGVHKQIIQLAASIAAVVLFAVIGLQLTVKPSYPLIMRPTPTATLEPFYIGDPRLATRAVTFGEAQTLAEFRLLRPSRVIETPPNRVSISETGSRVAIVLQTYDLPTRDGGPGTLTITQTSGNPPFRGGFQTQQISNTVTLAMPDGRQQPATLTQSSFGTNLSWTDQNGFVSLRVRVEGAPWPTERLVELATSLR